MTCVDANILIAALDSSDGFHDLASAALIEHETVALNVTWAEALIHPVRIGKADEARDILEMYGVDRIEVTDEIAFTAARLRAEHGPRGFPLLDALVVAAGVVRDEPVLTADRGWPSIPDVEIRLIDES